MKAKAENVVFRSTGDNWATPKDLYDELNGEFNFDFDPCPLKENPDIDGLAIEWGESNFVNPPYSDIKNWCTKAVAEWEKGKTVVMLIPSRTDTKYWHEFIMRADEIRFVKGRLKFGNAKHNAPFPSAVIIFRGC